VRQLLRETVSGYTPDGEIVDWIHQQRRLGALIISHPATHTLLTVLLVIA
jgi:hypothetical protein